MTFPKPTFAISTPCTIHFECMESGPNYSTRVRRITGILRRARVKIFIVAYGSFWFGFSGFSSNLSGHHETKIAKRIWSSRSKYSNFYVEHRLPMTDEGVLNRFRTFRAVKLQPIWSYRYERRLIFRRKRASFQFSETLGRDSFTFVRLHDKTHVLRTRVDLCYHRNPFPKCVGEVFNHLSVQTSFLRIYV